MIELNTVKPLEDKNVLVEEKDSSKPESRGRYYILKKDKADEFIKGKNNEKQINTLQTITTALLSAFLGAYVSTSIKSNPVIKVLGGLAVTAGVYTGVKKVDSYVSKRTENNLLDCYKAEEITNNKEKLTAAMDYTAPAEETIQEKTKTVETPAETQNKQ